jgi:acetyltransferase-like isoleucine patch superfamily enzyme
MQPGRSFSGFFMGVGRIERLLRCGIKTRTRLFTLLISSAFKEFGAGSRIDPPFRFYGLNWISLGENVMVNGGCWMQVVPGHADDKTAKLIIKSHAGIGMGAHISAARQVVIEEFVLLGRNVHISDHAHAYENISAPISQQGINRIAPVTIERETWLGENVLVLPGVTIGKHCVIGANSVVNTSIPDFSVAVGAPARLIKQYNRETCAWERIE